MHITLQFDSVEDMAKWMGSVRIVAPFTKPPPPQGSSVDDLEFTARTMNCLKADEILTVEQLCGWTENRLLMIPNMGRRSVNEIKEVLASRGLALTRP